MGWITVNEGNGYKIRARDRSTNAFRIVVVEWEHPNYGYFSDWGVWCKPAHYDEWELMCSVAAPPKQKTLKGFLKAYPTFTDLFEDDANPLMDVIGKEIKKMRGEVKR